MSDLQRLHISPLDPDLLRIILSESARQSAANISYHTLQTLPNRRYGYVDLPLAEADRLRKKLHGSILQGTKMKVEKARLEKTRIGSGDADESINEGRSRPEDRNKPGNKREDGVLPGVVLPEDRKVKRGWTEPIPKERRKSKSGKKSAREDATAKPSAHTDGPECLFKTKVPPNARGNVSQDAVAASKMKKRKRGNAEKTVVVHEFEKTTKHPSFLRNGTVTKGKNSASAYVEGKGWVDENGGVIEAEKSSRNTRSKATNTNGGIPEVVNTQEKTGEFESKRGTLRPRRPTRKVQHQTLSDETSSSGDTNSDHGDKTITVKITSPKKSQQSDGSIENDYHGESEVNINQVRALSISRFSPTPPSEATKEVHPLETLFKRPKSAASQTPRKPPLEVKTAFSFFDPGAEQEDNVPMGIPQTPFTQQDFQERRLRSAAPTPDTAAPSRSTFGRVWSRDSVPGDSGSDKDQEDDESTPIASTTAGKQEPEDDAKESEFAKWFYEHRGETNRAWKRRRREAAKEKRQKDNKRR
ncbi:MAG: hypothetical protein Q9170_005916 [Blastenia crenularia]